MISRKNILKLEKRREIYNFILENPGLHLREISRRTNISVGGLRHHLNFLKKIGLIDSKPDHRYTRYYVNQTVGAKDKEIINLLRQDIPRRIILLLFCIGPGDIYKNKKAMEKAKKDPSSYLRTYSKKELIELTKYWKGPYAKLFYLHKHPTTLDFHLQKLLDVDIIDKVKVGKDIKYRIKDPDRIFSALIIYNYELSEDTINIFLMWTKIFSLGNIERVEKLVLDVFPHPYHP